LIAGTSPPSANPGPAGYLRIQTRRYLLPDGSTANWDILAGGRTTVAVLSLTTDDMVVLVRQFRPGPGRVLLELPGGAVADKEDVRDAAHPELREETGYQAGAMTVIGRTWLAGYATTERYAAGRDSAVRPNDGRSRPPTVAKQRSVIGEVACRGCHVPETG
jgi:ADP-ribose diphosphatase